MITCTMRRLTWYVNNAMIMVYSPYCLLMAQSFVLPISDFEVKWIKIKHCNRIYLSIIFGCKLDNNEAIIETELSDS